MSIDNKNPLYRKVNKITHNGFRFYCQESDRYRFEKHKKKYANKNRIAIKRKQHRHEYDYAPLYKFLLSCVGREWDKVFEECQSRLDKVDPIMDMVTNVNKRGLVVEYPEFSNGYPCFFHDWRACDDSRTYWSCLYVDNDGILRYVNESFTFTDIKHTDLYSIHTGSWNGKPIYPNKDL